MTSIADEAGWPEQTSRTRRPPSVATAADRFEHAFGPAGGSVAADRAVGNRTRRQSACSSRRARERMARGLFELRKDSVTGWWVAVVVDREFDRAALSQAGQASDQTPDICPNCSVAGRRRRPRCACSSRTRSSSPAPSASSARQSPTAASRAGPGRRHRLVPDHRRAARPPRVVRGDHAADRVRAAGAHARRARGRPQRGEDRIPPGRPELRPAGRRPDRPPVLRLLRPAAHPASHRRGAGRRGALRDPRGRLPVLPARPRRGGRTARLVFEDSASVCFAPYASRSPFELWVVPRHHAADFGTATDAQLVSAAETLQKVLQAARHARRPGVQPGAAHGAAAASASTRPSTGTGRSTRACARSPGWSWARACRSTRSRPKRPPPSCSTRPAQRRSRPASPPAHAHGTTSQ